MYSRIFRLLAISFFAMLLLSGCQKKEGALAKRGDKEKISIFVSILPQKYLVDHIGGKYVKTIVMVDPGQDPHEYEPTPQKILELSKCNYYIEVGFPFESILVQKVATINKNLKFIDSASGINTLIDPANPESGNDPHIWLSLKNDKIMSKNIYSALIAADPKHKEYFKENYDSLMKIFDSTNKEIDSILSGCRGDRFLVFHPAFGYFAKDYGLIQESVEVEGKSPTPRDFVNLMISAKKENIKRIFVEPEFDQSAADRLAKAINAKIVIINPLAENIPQNLIDIARKLKESFDAQKKENQ